MNNGIELSGSTMRTGMYDIAPGFGIEPGADESPLHIDITEADKANLRLYVDDLRFIGSLAARRPGARPENPLFSR